jgi:ABC-type branched-subunit amino acid transport system ATPase component
MKPSSAFTWGSGAVLRVDNVYAGYRGATVLSGVSLHVGAGEIVAILGRNGVGKTTLLRTIMGLLPVQRGQILLEGQGDLTRLPTHARARAGLGYVPQGRQIFPRLSVYDNLRVAAVAAGQDPATRIAAVIAEFPILEPRLQVRGARLSGGEQQILALARALVTQPRILLLDEAAEGMQPSLVDVMIEKVRDLNHAYGMAVLLVEQNLEFAVGAASRAYIMSRGHIAREMPARDVTHDLSLQHEYLGV